MVWRRAVLKPALAVANRVVTEVADQASAEAGQFGEQGDAVAIFKTLNKTEGVLVLRAFDDLVVLPYLNLLPIDHQAGGRRKANDGIASPLLSSLGRFQQVGVGPSGNF